MKPQYLPQISLIHADKPQNNKNSLYLKLIVFLCDIMQPAAFLCAICVICGRIFTQEYSIYIAQMKPQKSPADLADLRRQTTKHQNNKPQATTTTLTLARTHRLFQKYQCRSVYTLTIRMLHPLFSLFNCHHCVVCRNVISASLSPCQLELVSSQNMAYTHDVAVVDADVAILILHPLHNLCCRESQ